MSLKAEHKDSLAMDSDSLPQQKYVSSQVAQAGFLSFDDAAFVSSSSWIQCVLQVHGRLEG